MPAMFLVIPTLSCFITTTHFGPTQGFSNLMPIKSSGESVKQMGVGTPPRHLIQGEAELGDIHELTYVVSVGC